MRLVHLAYVSTSRLGGDPQRWRPEVDRIVASARRLNAANGITGYLMFDGVEFAQILEGDEPAVMGTFLRILADRAHAQVNVLVRGAILERRFADWRMGLALREGDMAEIFVRHGIIKAGDIGRAPLEPLLALAVELAGQMPSPPHPPA
jgi:hypothetical protein